MRGEVGGRVVRTSAACGGLGFSPLTSSLSRITTSSEVEEGGGLRGEGHDEAAEEERLRVILFKPMRTWGAISGIGTVGGPVAEGLDLTSAALRFLERLPFDGVVWVLRWTPMGERKLSLC